MQNEYAICSFAAHRGSVQTGLQVHLDGMPNCTPLDTDTRTAASTTTANACGSKQVLSTEDLLCMIYWGLWKVKT